LNFVKSRRKSYLLKVGQCNRIPILWLEDQFRQGKLKIKEYFTLIIPSWLSALSKARKRLFLSFQYPLGTMLLLPPGSSANGSVEKNFYSCDQCAEKLIVPIVIGIRGFNLGMGRRFVLPFARTSGTARRVRDPLARNICSLRSACEFGFLEPQMYFPRPRAQSVQLITKL